jgi:Family of unknown function (DUF6244)
MSLIRDIDGDLAGMAAGIGRAQKNTAAAVQAAGQIAARTAASGFTGIAQAMGGVGEAIKQLYAQLDHLGGQVDEARTPVAATPEQVSPQRTISVLAPTLEKIATIGAGIGTAIAKVDQVRQQTAASLEGGQPGPMLARLDAIKQVLIAVHQQGETAKQHVEAALTAARKAGEQGN